MTLRWNLLPVSAHPRWAVLLLVAGTLAGLTSDLLD
jgi:hypothetical protein